MLSFVVLILTGSLMVHGGQTNPMPNETLCHGKHGVLVAVPNSCNDFLMCIKGNAILSSCGPFYRFNPLIRFCDLPTNVECHSESSVEAQKGPASFESLPVDISTPPTVTEVSVIPSICEHQRNGALLADTTSCSHYYVCVMQQELRRNCPPGMHFNSMRKVCQAPAYAKCRIAFNSPMIKKRPARPLNSSICSTAGTGMLHAHDTDCGKLYSCAHGRAIEMRCPAGLHFSVALNRCDYPDVANCAVSAAVL